MVDKIAVQKDDTQVYSTQYRVNNGQIEFLPIIDPEHVNERREEAGMESIEEYLEIIKSTL